MHCPFQWRKRLLHNHNKKVTKHERGKPIQQLIHLDYFTWLCWCLVARFLGGEFVGGEIPWWRGDQIPFYSNGLLSSYKSKFNFLARPGGHKERKQSENDCSLLSFVVTLNFNVVKVGQVCFAGCRLQVVGCRLQVAGWKMDF